MVGVCIVINMCIQGYPHVDLLTAAVTQPGDDILSHPLELPTWTTLESAEPESATSDEEDQLNTTPPRSPSVPSRKRKLPASSFETPKPRAKFPRTTRKSAQRVNKSIMAGGIIQSPFKLQHSPNPVFCVQPSPQSIFQPFNSSANNLNRRVSFQDTPPAAPPEDHLSLFDVTVDSDEQDHVEAVQPERLAAEGTSSFQTAPSTTVHQGVYLISLTRSRLTSCQITWALMSHPPSRNRNPLMGGGLGLERSLLEIPETPLTDYWTRSNFRVACSQHPQSRST